jgi:hypothetical protein
VDGSGAADEGAGAADVGAADGVTGWVDTSSIVGEEGDEGEEGEEAEEGATGAEEGETIEMNVLAAVSFADDMMKSASHASPVDSNDKRQRQQLLCRTKAKGEREDLSASRVSAALGSWFVPGGTFSRYAGAGPLLLAVALGAATGGGTDTNDDVWRGRSQWNLQKNGGARA